MLPALILGFGMFLMPFSPRWLLEVGREDEAVSTLAYLRRSSEDSPAVVNEFLEIKADVMSVRRIRASKQQGEGKLARLAQPYLELVSTRSNFHRLFMGCFVMFTQQFLGCNAISKSAPDL